MAVGNTITINNIQLSLDKASVEDGNELFIGQHFSDIQVVTRPTGSAPSSPPNSPPFFPEVRQKNQAWNQEENDLTLLVAKLLHLIDQNKEIIQKGRNLGLNVPDLPQNVLNYFQEEFFSLLHEDLALIVHRINKLMLITKKLSKKSGILNKILIEYIMIIKRN